MTLIENWKKVATTAWSARLAYLAAFLSAAEVALPYIEPALEVVISKGTFAIMAVLVSSASAIARVVQQNSLHPNG